jgi:capsular exopolysaccharide synthesis family protein
MESLPSHPEYADRELETGAGQNIIRDAMRVLRKQWLMVVIPLICVLAIVFVLTKRKAPIYEASTRVMIGQSGVAPNSTGTGQELLQQLLATNRQASLGTQIELLRSPDLAVRALPKSVFKKGDPQIVVTPVPDTDVIDLTAYWFDPVEGADIANRLVEQYEHESEAANRKAIKSALEYVNTQLEKKVGPDLNKTQLDMRRFQEVEGVVVLPEQAATTVAQVSAIESQIQAAETLIATNKIKLPEAQQRAHEEPKKIEPTKTWVENPAVTALETKIQDLELQKTTALFEHVPTSPTVLALDDQIKNVKAKLKEFIDKDLQTKVTGKTVTDNPAYQTAHEQVVTLHTERLATMAQLRALRGEQARLMAVMQALPVKQFKQANLQREYDVLNKSYQDLRQQKQTLELSQSYRVSNISVLSKAAPNDRPVSPNLRINMALAAILGILLGLGLAYVREYMSDTVDTVGHVQSGVGLPVIGAIPTMKGIAGLVLQRDALTPEMEGYHFVASALPMGHRESTTRTLLMTSAGSGAGNSTTVANLATAFAQRQKAVVLVDLDLRKPTLHTLFNVAEGPGISDVIAGRKLLAEALHPTAVEGLLVMPAGSSRESPIRTLSSPALSVVLQDLANVADVVLIDSPPCVTVTDASIIAPWADGTILLLRAGETDRRTAQRARSLLSSVGASLLGVILNRASTGLEGFAYARHYRRVAPPALGPGA